MLLAVDVGNTQTVIGIYDGERLADHWRVATEPRRTGDELGVMLAGFFDLTRVSGVCLSSTVPALVRAYEHLAERWAAAPLLVVGPGTRTGMVIRVDDPRQLGPDRIVNAVAASALYPGEPVVIVDFGTAITVDAVSARGEYLGGAIAPGIETAATALFQSTAQIRRVELVAPAHVIGKNTVTAVQSGIVFGTAALVDGLVEQVTKELGGSARVVATGGHAGAVIEHSNRIEQIEPHLTLQGLKLIFELNAVRTSP